MIDWTKHFDRVFCIFYLPRQDRIGRITEELKRVGLLQSANFEWRFTVPSEYDKKIKECYPNEKWVGNISYINQTLENIRIFKESLLCGYKRILVLEDDAAFLKDLGKLEEVIADIPMGYDIIQLDKGCGSKDKVIEWEKIKGKKVNRNFIDATGHQFGLFTANVYGQEGLRKAIAILESKPIAMDKICQYGDFKLAVALTNGCIQVISKGAVDNNGIKSHYIYKSLGIDYGKYNLPKGYDEKEVYFPKENGNEEIKKMENMKTVRTPPQKWDRFDYVGVLCYTGYKDRVEELLPELKRVGLFEKARLHWDVPSLFMEKLSSAVGKTSFCSRPGCFNMTVGHYTILKTAYELGCQSALVLEDDMRFLKNLDEIADILNSIPMDYDHIMLDRNRLTTTDLKVFAGVTEEQRRNKWIEFDEAGSTGCYAMSRRGMKHYIDLIEEDIRAGNVHNPDHYFRARLGNRIYWDKTYKRYFCYPNIAVQSIAGKHGSFSNLVSYWENLSPAGLKQEDYNLSVPVVNSKNYSLLLENAMKKQPERDREGRGFCKDNYDIIKSIDSCCTTEGQTGVQFDRCYLWGMNYTEANREVLQVALRDSAQITLGEHGYISRVTTRESRTDRFGKPRSVVFDTLGFYFDATRKTQIESMLNDSNLIVTPKQRAEARRLINKLVSNKVSRYNHQPIKKVNIGRADYPKVLVVDQTFGDRCITLGKADESTFAKMLRKAIEENPASDIIVKTHPCVIDGLKCYGHGYYDSLKEHANIYKVTFPINPYSLMEICDKVYVCTSQFGLEALMAGKEVHVFGMPFYAGWGLTIDDQHLERRTNMRTLEELFYIFYCMYTHWVDPDKGCETTIDAVIDKMIALRNEYQKNPQKFASVANTGSPVIRKGYNLYRKPLLPRANKPIVIPPRYGAKT